MRLKRPHFQLGRSLFLQVCILSLLGILIVFEASAAESLSIYNDNYHMTVNQLQWLGLGFVVLLIASRIPISLWKSFSGIIYILGVILLIAVLIPGLGVEVKGATRWLSIAGFRFQPVEVMKFGIITYFASWLTQHQRVTPFLTFSLVPASLLLLQPDLGSTLIILTISFALFVASGGSLKWVLSLAGLGIGAVLLLILISPYRRERLQTYLDPSADPFGDGYHMRQITIALGNGGWLGQGIGQSRQKYQYIPEVSTDSIFSIVAEETGLLGSTVMLGLFAYFIHTCFAIVRLQEEESFAYLLAVGLTVWISAQIIMNLAAVVALVPLTGVPLPFISRGGTALITVMLASGILIALSKQEKSD